MSSIEIGGDVGGRRLPMMGEDIIMICMMEKRDKPNGPKSTSKERWRRERTDELCPKCGVQVGKKMFEMMKLKNMVKQAKFKFKKINNWKINFQCRRNRTIFG